MFAICFPFILLNAIFVFQDEKYQYISAVRIFQVQDNRILYNIYINPHFSALRMSNPFNYNNIIIIEFKFTPTKCTLSVVTINENTRSMQF